QNVKIGTNSSSPSSLAYSSTLLIGDKNDEFKNEDDELEDAKSEDNTLALHLEDIT
ncbi:22318_t:CDS:1, partial [Gigaspora rosea]